MAVVAWILVVNVAYAVWFAVTEFVLARRARREMSELEALWRLPSPRRGRRLGRVLAGSLAVLVVGGVAIASPRDVAEHIAERVSHVIGSVAGDPDDGERAAPAEAGVAPSNPAPTRHDSVARRESMDVKAGSSDDRGRSEAVVDDAVAPTGAPAPTPGAGGPPPATEGTPSPSAPLDPSPTAPPALTFDASADAVSTSAIVVMWERVPTATTYTVHRSDVGGAPLLVGEVSAGKREILVEGLSAGASYDFTVTALSPHGVLGTSSASATTLATLVP